MKFFLVLFLLPLALVAVAQEQQPQPQQQLPAAKATPRTEAELAAQTVVVFNQNDINSIALAGFYAEARKIPTLNLVGLKCPQSEEISRQDYDQFIAEPLRKVFVERGWWTLREKPTETGRVEKTGIRFVVLIRGVPLKIAQTREYEGDSTAGDPPVVFTRNDAAVDSELSTLGLYTRQISGIQNNPFFASTKIIGETDPGFPLLVCRLDAAQIGTVRAMISDSLATEKEGLRGFVYVDTQGLKGSGLALGDSWLLDAARDAREHGLPVILDNGPVVFPTGYPMQHCALYLGWYTDNAAGPFAEAGFKLPRGAVAYHIHSFSALSLRDPQKYWCAPLLADGAAATLGNVYEPFLGLLPRPNVLEQRLREGFTFGEAAYMSQPFLSWMTTFVGDPLYRPFMNSAAAAPKPGDEWDAYREGVTIWLTKGRAAGEEALKSSAAKLKSGIVYECWGLLELSGNDYGRAITAFGEARAAYQDSADRVRVALHEGSAIRVSKGAEAAVKFLGAQAAANANSTILTKLADSFAAEAKAAAKGAEKGAEKKPAKPEEKEAPVEKKPPVTKEKKKSG